jgi:hypothetical protein
MLRNGKREGVWIAVNIAKLPELLKKPIEAALGTVSCSSALC